MARMIPETMLEFDPQGREDVVFKALKTGQGICGARKMAAGALLGIKPELIFVDPNAIPEDYSAVVANRIGKLREDFSAGDIVVLSCSPYGDGHSRLEKKLTPRGDNRRMFNQVYRFSTYRKFKGLDAPVVVLVDVDRNAFVASVYVRSLVVGLGVMRHALDAVVVADGPFFGVSRLVAGDRN